MNNEIKQVLEYVNWARVALDLEPLTELPKGIRCHPNFCPLARALNYAYVYDDIFEFEEPDDTLKVSRAWGYSTEEIEAFGELPDVLANFVEHFDQGDYPDLEQER